MTKNCRDPEAIADEVLPLGGPYTAEALADAAGLLSELVRRLNHATFFPDLDYPSQADAVVGRLAGAMAGMPQLCKQVGGLLAAFRDRPGVYADAAAKGRTPEAVIAEARSALALAGSHADAAADALNTARNLTARIGIHTNGEDVPGGMPEVEPLPDLPHLPMPPGPLATTRTPEDRLRAAGTLGCEVNPTAMLPDGGDQPETWGGDR